MGTIYGEEVVHALNVKNAWDLLIKVETKNMEDIHIMDFLINVLKKLFEKN